MSGYLKQKLFQAETRARDRARSALRGVEGSQPFKGTNETTDPTGSGFERTSIEAAKSEMGHFLDVGAFLNEARSTPKKVPIVLQKSFCGMGLKFSGP